MVEMDSSSFCPGYWSLQKSTTTPHDDERVREMIPSVFKATSELNEICLSIPVTPGRTREATETDREFFRCLADLFRCYRRQSASAHSLSEKESLVLSTMYRIRKAVEVSENIIPVFNPVAAHPVIKVAIRDAFCCGVQVLANCCRDCQEIQDRIWPQFFELIGSLIVLEDDKLLNYTAATIMNCLHDDRVDQVVDRGYAARIFERVAILKTNEEPIEKYEALFELCVALLQSQVVVDRDFDLLQLGARCVIFDMLKSCFTLTDCGEYPELPPFWPGKIAREFIQNYQCLLRLKDSSQDCDEECSLILKSMQLLATLTAAQRFRPLFVSDVALFDAVVELFCQIDDLSMQDGNQFSSINKLGDVKPNELVTPTRGVKGMLLRLLANLVYNNVAFEHRLKEKSSNFVLRLIHNARIDYRNPYLQQWAILAIRNLHYTAAMEQIRQMHEQESKAEAYVPRVAHSVDGDCTSFPGSAAVEQRTAAAVARRLGSQAVEALDLEMHSPRKEHRRRPHHHRDRAGSSDLPGDRPHLNGEGSKHRKPAKETVKQTQNERPTQGTQTDDAASGPGPSDDFRIEKRRKSLENLTEGDEESSSNDTRPRFQSR